MINKSVCASSIKTVSIRNKDILCVGVNEPKILEEHNRLKYHVYNFWCF